MDKIPEDSLRLNILMQVQNLLPSTYGEPKPPIQEYIAAARLVEEYIRNG